MQFTDRQLDQLQIAVKAAIYDATRGIEARIGHLKDEIDEIRRELKVNTDSTAEVLQIVATTKRGARFVGTVVGWIVRLLKWTGVQLKWLAPLVVAALAAWTWLKDKVH